MKTLYAKIYHKVKHKHQIGENNFYSVYEWQMLGETVGHAFSKAIRGNVNINAIIYFHRIVFKY